MQRYLGKHVQNEKKTTCRSDAITNSDVTPFAADAASCELL
jgi:hypothetical protein